MIVSSALIITSIILGIMSLCMLYRVFKGPSVIDRVLAGDIIDLLLGVIMIIFGVLLKRSLFIDLGLIVTLLGFIGTVLICKYLEGDL
ncbi:MAG: monovalent cation/H+ antiporter complex subunit F [Clostridium sp.]